MELMVSRLNTRGKGVWTLLVALAVLVIFAVPFRRPARWRIHTGQPTALPVQLVPDVVQLLDYEVSDGRVIYAAENDVVSARDARSGKEHWRTTLNNGFVYSSAPKEGGGHVFAGDTTGTLRAFDANSGRLLWTYAQGESLAAPVRSSGRSGWFGSFALSESLVFVGGRDGKVVALRQKDGKTLWRHDTSSPIISLIAKRGVIAALNQSRQLIVLSSQGERLWIDELKDPASFLVFGGGNSLAVIGAKGDVVGKDMTSGKTRFVTHLAQTVAKAPIAWENSFLIVTDEPRAKLIKMDGQTGAIVWSLAHEERIWAAPVVGYRNPFLSGLCAMAAGRIKVPSICLPTIFIGDLGGTLWAVDEGAGTAVWKFHTSAPVIASATPRGNGVVFGNLGGDVYNVAVFDGKTPKRWGWSRLSASRAVEAVSDRDIQEFTVVYPATDYYFPWHDITVQASFWQKDAKPILINGYYFDKDTWKIKFNPPATGEWLYEIFLILPDDSVVTKRGSFVSKTSSENMYLHSVYMPGGVGSLTADGKTIFPVLGIQTAELDFNRNGNYLDDFSSGIDAQEDTGTLEQFLDLHADGGRVFNTFRWGQNNASFGLGSEPNSIEDMHALFEGRQADRLAASVAGSGLRLWLTMFESAVPYQAQWDTSPMYEFLVKRYIRYVVARYGVYVSVWELTNEAIVPDRIVGSLSTYIRSMDYEKRPITTSWEKNHLSVIEIVSPHWYANEDARLSDASMVAELSKNQSLVSGKPVVFGEIGNKAANWDRESAVRMRIRMWTAAMHRAGTIFWSTSHTKQYAPAWDPLANGNQYIGQEERQSVRSINGFLKNMSVSARPYEFRVNSGGVRGHGLADAKGLYGYFHRYDDHNVSLPLSVSFQIPKGGTLVWYDTKTGQELFRQRVQGGWATAGSPPFAVDVSLKVMLDP